MTKVEVKQIKDRTCGNCRYKALITESAFFGLKTKQQLWCAKPPYRSLWAGEKVFRELKRHPSDSCPMWADEEDSK